MMSEEQGNLLEQFLGDRSERAFGALVQRYLPLVHAVAFRTLRDAELARDVSQQVFIRLAAKADGIRQECALAAWLHRTTHSLAVDTVRREQRRKLREQQAADSMSLLSSPGPEVSWEALAPVLDDLLNRLPEDDRRVILLRYYENRSIASVATSLGIREKAASKRALRALERLRGLFGRRGISTSAAALANLLPLHAAPAPPAGLAAVIGASSFSAWPATVVAQTTPWFAAPLIKAGLAAAGLILLTWVSYDSARSTRDHTQSKAPAAAATTSSASSSRRQPRPAARDLSELEGIARMTNLFERQRALGALLSGLPRADLPQAAARLAGLGYDGRSGEMKMLTSAWAATDSQAALAFAHGPQGSPDLIAMVTADWSKKDLSAAFAFALAESSRSTGDLALEQMLIPLSARDPQRAFQLMAEAATVQSNDSRAMVAVELLLSDPGRLRERLAQLPAGMDTAALMTSLTAAISQRGERFRRNTDGEGYVFDKVLFSDRPSRFDLDDQKIAAEWIVAHPGLLARDWNIDAPNLFHGLAIADLEAAERLARQIPASAGTARGEILKGVARRIESIEGAAAAKAWLSPPELEFTRPPDSF